MFTLLLHLQAVVLSELVLLLLGQMADESVKVRDHILVCQQGLQKVLESAGESHSLRLYQKEKKKKKERKKEEEKITYLVKSFKGSLGLRNWKLARIGGYTCNCGKESK
jgi:hypothetical protein